jgi:hypothetical protein
VASDESIFSSHRLDKNFMLTTQHCLRQRGQPPLAGIEPSLL